MQYKNILNVEDIDKLVKRLSRERPEHVAVWLRSTFSRWLRKGNGTTLQCVCARQLNDPITKLTMALAAASTGANVQEQIAKHLHPVKVKDLPDWAQESMTEHELWFWSPTNEDLELYGHWIDYLLTLPERDIRMTVDQLVTAVAAWDKQLAKQKLIASLSDGVEFIESPALDATDGYYMVKLLTQTAYKSEGAVMSHCVGGYFGRKDTLIYSLRRQEQAKPCATIEVKITKNGEHKIVQVKAFANKKIADPDAVALKAWVQEVGFTVYNRYYDEDGDDGDDEAWDEAEEADDDEEPLLNEDDDIRPARRVRPRASNSDEDDEEEDAEEDDEDDEGEDDEECEDCDDDY